MDRSTAPVIDLATQLAFATKTRIELAYELALQDFVDRRAEIVADVVPGLIEGYPQYGDKSWHKDREALLFEELKEARDKVAYRLMGMWQD